MQTWDSAPDNCVSCINQGFPQVAKSVSLRLYNELEVAQKIKSQLEWENEALREKTQELEVAKQVLQAEVEKTREVSSETWNTKLIISLKGVRIVL